MRVDSVEVEGELWAAAGEEAKVPEKKAVGAPTGAVGEDATVADGNVPVGSSVDVAGGGGGNDAKAEVEHDVAIDGNASGLKAECDVAVFSVSAFEAEDRANIAEAFAKKKVAGKESGLEVDGDALMLGDVEEKAEDVEMTDTPPRRSSRKSKKRVASSAVGKDDKKSRKRQKRA